MSTTVNACISFLEETNDPGVAYFSFDADASGDAGMIRANKEGLRLYAMELLKKSMEMEATHPAEPICFGNPEWLVSDAGYNLIGCVQPEYTSRHEIIAEDLTAEYGRSSSGIQRNGCMLGILLLTGSLLTIAAAIECFC